MDGVGSPAVAVKFLWDAYRGTGIYSKEKPRDHLRLIATIRSATYFLVAVRSDLGITDLSQLKKPRRKILGIEVAGDVEAVGKNVRRFKPGDPVFGAAMMKMSCTAEYICLPEKSGLALKPANMTYEQGVILQIRWAWRKLFYWVDS